MMIRFAAAFLLATVASLHAQQPAPHPALQSREAFLAELAGKTWECSFTIYPRLRFGADKIEILDDRRNVTSTLVKVSQPEPGMVRVDYNSGQFA